MFVTASWKTDLIILFATFILCLLIYITKAQKYWSRKGVYTPKFLPFIGHFSEVLLLKTTLAEWLKTYYDSTDEKYFGLYVFDEPIFVVKDPMIVKDVLIKDFSYFPDRQVGCPRHDILQQHFLFLQKSPSWRLERTKLTSAFTSGRLKAMFNLINRTGLQLRDWIENNLGVLEAKEMAAKFSTDVIAKCAFGIDSKCFIHEKPIFRELGRKFFDSSWRNAVSQTIYFMKPTWVDKLKIDFVDNICLKFFGGVFLETMKNRSDQEKCNDIIDIFKELVKDKVFTDDGSDDCVFMGMAIQFFMAGFETTSATISFTLYEFCMNNSIQLKARKEALTIFEKYKGKLTYEAIKEANYLDMCINETLRRYPVLPFLDRRCNQDYKIAGTDLIIKKGTSVFVPMYGLQMDEKYFPNPYKYDPDRFLNKIDSKNGVYYMPFGEGPRICIGERFGKLTTSLALLYIMANFELEKCEKTPDPVVFEPGCFLLQASAGLPIKFKKLTV